ncbi:hypothetical protein EUB48_05895 [Rhodoferax sediminis]|uniref:Carbohydrate kinase PfkB domain-containing protein n=1 Tax=Rhodoferax sediminis TaxID=2509614 RepID=A0A515D914_9BURK|nr:hypothetical protein EUB48_05895 [Rhodoferax sediminis]
MTRVAVFGEMLVDRFESGPVVGGAPFNVARHLAAFGHAPLMLSAVGVDEHTALVMREFDRYGMRRDGVQITPDHPTGVVDVQTAPDGGHRFSIRFGSAWDFIEETPARAAATALDPAGWLYAGTLALRSPVSRAAAWAVLRSHPGPVYLDLNWREGQVPREVVLQAIDLADVLKVNDEELAWPCCAAGSMCRPPARYRCRTAPAICCNACRCRCCSSPAAPRARWRSTAKAAVSPGAATRGPSAWSTRSVPAIRSRRWRWQGCCAAGTWAPRWHAPMRSPGISAKCAAPCRPT